MASIPHPPLPGRWPSALQAPPATQTRPQAGARPLGAARATGGPEPWLGTSSALILLTTKAPGFLKGW